MRQYKVCVGLRTLWLSYAATKGILEGWFKQLGCIHYCNQISDPNACCPTAHGASESDCTCTSPDKYFVSREVEDGKISV
jgi:hypothetical protein